MITRRQSKSIPLMYGGIAAVVLIVIAALALVFIPPSPPQVAEFAPQAQEQIDDSLDNQSSQFGNGEGTCAIGQVCESTEGNRFSVSQKKVIEKARVRRCVGNPPRQTEDPQSPPCIGFWEGNNGGSTAKGVTGDEIRVVIPADAAQYAPLIDHFNRRYEFYGRKLRLMGVSGSGTVAAQRADEEAKGFAAIDSYGNPQVPRFSRELARRKLVGVTIGGDYLMSSDFEAGAPYLWAFHPPLDVLERSLVEMACKSLVGRPARHGGTYESTRIRKFAIAVQTNYEPSPNTDLLVTGLTRCGAEVRVDEYRSTEDPPDSPEIAVMVGEWQSSGVTTVIPIDSSGQSSIMRAASQSGYQPEWLHIGLNGQELVGGYQSGLSPPEQVEHIFGVASRNKTVPLADKPWYWAVRESRPDYTLKTQDSIALQTAYRELLVLASGIQMAGPRLTASTLQAGLVKARFPNPGAAQPPYWQATVGFGQGDWSMVDDLALKWWDRSADALDEGLIGAGSWCYVERGARWALESWPEREHPFFDRTRPCR